MQGCSGLTGWQAGSVALPLMSFAFVFPCVLMPTSTPGAGTCDPPVHLLLHLLLHLISSHRSLHAVILLSFHTLAATLQTTASLIQRALVHPLDPPRLRTSSIRPSSRPSHTHRAPASTPTSIRHEGRSSCCRGGHGLWRRGQQAQPRPPPPQRRPRPDRIPRGHLRLLDRLLHHHGGAHA